MVLFMWVVFVVMEDDFLVLLLRILLRDFDVGCFLGLFLIYSGLFLEMVGYY